MAGRIRGSTAGKPSKDMNNSMPASWSVRAKRPAWSSNCVKPSGGPRPKRMPAGSANSATSRTDGASPTGSWPCATRRRARNRKEETEQYQLFATSQYKYRVFVTDFVEPIDFVVWFYGQRGGAENLIKEANNDAGLAAHPSGRFDVNSNHFQLAMLAYNLNCWLMLFNREPQADATALRHTTLATSRLRFLFVA